MLSIDSALVSGANVCFGTPGLSFCYWLWIRRVTDGTKGKKGYIDSCFEKVYVT